MAVPEKQLHRAAQRVTKALVEEKLVTPKETLVALEKLVYDALRANFMQEAEILREAERILEENKRQTTGMDQRTLLVKIKEKLARERGFVL